MDCAHATLCLASDAIYNNNLPSLGTYPCGCHKVLGEGARLELREVEELAQSYRTSK